LAKEGIWGWKHRITAQEHVNIISSQNAVSKMQQNPNKHQTIVGNKGMERMQ
jgi:hypothetical protein